MRHGPAAVMQRLARGEAVARDEYFFRTSCASPPARPAWLHLNKVMALACGQRDARLVVLDVWRLG